MYKRQVFWGTKSGPCIPRGNKKCVLPIVEREIKDFKPSDDHCEEWREVKGGREGDATSRAPLKVDGTPYSFIRCKDKSVNILGGEQCPDDLWEHCARERDIFGEDTVITQTSVGNNSNGEGAGSGKSVSIAANESSSSGKLIDKNRDDYTLAKSISNKPVSEKRMYEIINDLLTSHRVPISSFIMNAKKGLLKPDPGDPKPYDSMYRVY